MVNDSYCLRCGGDLPHPIYHKEQPSRVREGYYCPDCAKKKIKAKLMKRNSRFGSFYSCQNYSKKEGSCQYKAKIGTDGKPAEEKKPEYTDKQCPKCKGRLVIRRNKRGDFLGCENYTKKKCLGIYGLDGNEIVRDNNSKKEKFNKFKKYYRF